MASGKPGLGAEAVLAAVRGQLGDGRRDAGVLPDQGVVDRLAGVAIPDDGGLALVGDADGGEVGGAEGALLQGGGDHFAGAPPDLVRIVLDPSGLGVDLFVLFLGDADDAAGMVENDEAGAGGSLVDRADVVGHSAENSIIWRGGATVDSCRSSREEDSAQAV